MDYLTMKSSDETYYNDDTRDITYSRRAARYLSRYRWYNPSANNTTSAGEQQGPCLDAAWAHYEHVTLARYYVDHNRTGDSFVRAPPGDESLLSNHKTKLYPVWKTPVKELMDFGISVRMYFSTLLVLSGITGVAALLNIPLIVYFWGYASQEEGDGIAKDGVDPAIRASAICDETEWVACETCNADYAGEYPDYRLDGTNVRRNQCNFDDWLTPGIWSFAASILFVILVGIAFFWKQRKAEIVFDEQVQTASDYSIQIENPPSDATDPEEWRRFFNHFADEEGKGVTLVTVALDNAKLVKALIQRRKQLKNLSKLLPYGIDMMDQEAVLKAVSATESSNSWISSILHPIFPDAKREWGYIQVTENDIRHLVQKTYKATMVFCTFESERAQRNALHALSTGKVNRWFNTLDKARCGSSASLTVFESARASSMWDVMESPQLEARTIRLKPSIDNDSSSNVSSTNKSSLLMFRGEHVLHVNEAPEPSDIRWTDLQASAKDRLELYIVSTIGMMAFVTWSGYFIFCLVESYPASYAALFITATNVIVPAVCQVINDLEVHPTEGGKQVSLYVKIALFRWFNSAISLSVISTFIESISVEDGNENMKHSLAYKVYPVILAELFCTPLCHLADPVQNFRKHILAPRARDQEEMNSYFTGERFNLAERYTDANKVLFVALFFSAIMPESFFLGAIALFFQYLAGKFCLLRLTGALPDIGFDLARLTRNWFFSVTLVAHIVMSAYWWSGYPYDNVCENDGEYSYCNQNFWGLGVFPPLPRFQPEGGEWMSESQATITSLYGWASVTIVLVAFVVIFWMVLIPEIKGLFQSTYEPDGMDQRIDFSSIKHLHEIHGYIPQTRVVGFDYPFLACDIRGVDEGLVGWKDQFRGFDPHNLICDVQAITGSEILNPVFSIVKEWGPKE